TLLGSGIMNLDEVISRGIDYAICTDVGASPTTSMLQEMSQFLKVHRGHSSRATPSEALFRSTLAPARMLGLRDVGTFEVGKPLSYLEIECDAPPSDIAWADDVILSSLLDTSTSELDDFVRQADPSLRTLQSQGLQIGPQLQMLTDEVEKARRKLDRKMRRAVMNGAVVWERE